MNAKDAFDLTARLIEFKSVTGDELELLDYLSSYLPQKFKPFNPKLEKIPGEDSRYSILFSFGEPNVVFTTHIDVVPAENYQFVPEIENGKLSGRGACDAKGILATMIAAVRQLLEGGAKNLGILIVFEEECSGIGARTSAAYLKDRGIKYVINGEPTENKLALGHKGMVMFEVNFSGVKAHSGYPELGEDANLKMNQALNNLYQADFGEDGTLGQGTINIGVVQGGTAGNIVSDRASFQALIRTVGGYQGVEAVVTKAVRDLGQIDFQVSKDPVKLKDLVEFKDRTMVAKYFTDIPNLIPIGAEFLMYGPGDIARAHTDFEYIMLDEIEQGIKDYQLIYHSLQPVGM